VIPADILDALITREREMTTLAAHGLSNDLIAERLFLSPLTVKTHVNRAMMKAAAAHLANHARAVATAGSRRLAVRKGGLR
jgi:DNA-binding CsgD family transcriptional regulator